MKVTFRLGLGPHNGCELPAPALWVSGAANLLLSCTSPQAASVAKLPGVLPGLQRVVMQRQQESCKSKGPPSNDGIAIGVNQSTGHHQVDDE